MAGKACRGSLTSEPGRSADQEKSQNNKKQRETRAENDTSNGIPKFIKTEDLHKKQQTVVKKNQQKTIRYNPP